MDPEETRRHKWSPVITRVRILDFPDGWIVQVARMFRLRRIAPMCPRSQTIAWRLLDLLMRYPQTIGIRKRYNILTGHTHRMSRLVPRGQVRLQQILLTPIRCRYILLVLSEIGCCSRLLRVRPFPRQILINPFHKSPIDHLI